MPSIDLPSLLAHLVVVNVGNVCAAATLLIAVICTEVAMAAPAPSVAAMPCCGKVGDSKEKPSNVVPLVDVERAMLTLEVLRKAPPITDGPAAATGPASPPTILICDQEWRVAESIA